MKNNEAKPAGEQLVSCTCNTCSGHIEFDADLFQPGTTIQCPHCGIDTILFIPDASGSLPRILEEPQIVAETSPPPQPFSGAQIITTTGNEISGRAIEGYLGIARGVVVRAPDMIQGVLGGLKQFVGGNIESYARVCEETRREAFSRMVEQAQLLNADAVIAMRYDATEFAPGITEVMAYGTAVKLKAQEDQP